MYIRSLTLQHALTLTSEIAHKFSLCSASRLPTGDWEPRTAPLPYWLSCPGPPPASQGTPCPGVGEPPLAELMRAEERTVQWNQTAMKSFKKIKAIPPFLPVPYLLCWFSMPLPSLPWHDEECLTHSADHPSPWRGKEECQTFPTPHQLLFKPSYSEHTFPSPMWPRYETRFFIPFYCIKVVNLVVTLLD